MAAIFWAEPFDTIDLDVFVLLPEAVHLLDPLRDVIEHLAASGYAFEGESLDRLWAKASPLVFLSRAGYIEPLELIADQVGAGG